METYCENKRLKQTQDKKIWMRKSVQQKCSARLGWKTMIELLMS